MIYSYTPRPDPTRDCPGDPLVPSSFPYFLCKGYRPCRRPSTAPTGAPFEVVIIIIIVVVVIIIITITIIISIIIVIIIIISITIMNLTRRYSPYISTEFMILP